MFGLVCLTAPCKILIIHLTRRHSEFGMFLRRADMTRGWNIVRRISYAGLGKLPAIQNATQHVIRRQCIPSGYDVIPNAPDVTGLSDGICSSPTLILRFDHLK